MEICSEWKPGILEILETNHFEYLRTWKYWKTNHSDHLRTWKYWNTNQFGHLGTSVIFVYRHILLFLPQHHIF